MTTLKRTVAALAALAALVMPSLVVADGATAQPNGKRGCSYAGPATTATSLSVNKTVMRQGEANSATATVTSGVGPVFGRLAFFVGGKKVAFQLKNGAATLNLRGLRAGKTYGIVAKYWGNCWYAPSTSEKKFVTVVGRGYQ